MRVLLILAFVLALGTAIPILDAISPFSASYQSPVPTGGFNEALILNATGCTNPNSAGNYGCSGGLTGAGSTSGGFFGTLANTGAIFGNFIAGIQFLLTISRGLFLPGSYVVQWLGGCVVAGPVCSANMVIVTLGLAALVQGMVMMAWGEGLFYMTTGRWLE